MTQNPNSRRRHRRMASRGIGDKSREPRRLRQLLLLLLLVRGVTSSSHSSDCEVNGRAFADIVDQ
jgi:hypothetical protein